MIPYRERLEATAAGLREQLRINADPSGVPLPGRAVRQSERRRQLRQVEAILAGLRAEDERRSAGARILELIAR